MTVKAKFRCESIIDTTYQGEGRTSRQVVFRAACGTEGENLTYCKATPSGEIKMTIDKDTLAYSEFIPGRDYYLTFDVAGS